MLEFIVICAAVFFVVYVFIVGQGAKSIMKNTRICPHCGTRIPKKFKVCSSCGRESEPEE